MSKQSDLECTLSNEELIKKGKEWIQKLIDTGGKDWSLRIPAEPNHDPDLIFSELCKRLSSLSAGGMRGWISLTDRKPEQEKEVLFMGEEIPPVFGRLRTIGKFSYVVTIDSSGEEELESADVYIHWL